MDAQRWVFEDSENENLRLTVSKQPDDFGYVGVVFITALNEDVLAGADDGGPRKTLYADR